MFQKPNPHRDKTSDVFTNSLDGFATTLAVMLAILGGPYLNAMTAPYVIDLARRSYGPDIVHLVELAWMVACFPFVFFAARASIGVALMMAGSFVAYRFL